MKTLFYKKETTLVPAEQKLPSLAFCLFMDIIGYATYSVPFLGEFLDVLWAPISAFIFWRLFGGLKGVLGGAFNFVEELLPGLDFIPTFTITWLIQYFRRNKPTYIIRPFTR